MVSRTGLFAQLTTQGPDIVKGRLKSAGDPAMWGEALGEKAMLTGLMMNPFLMGTPTGRAIIREVASRRLQQNHEKWGGGQ